MMPRIGIAWVLATMGCQDREVNRIMGTGEVTHVSVMAYDDRLRQAVREGRRADVEAMLRAGTDATQPDKLGATPLALAARHTDDAQLARLLHAAAPSTLELADSLRRTSLSWAAGAGHTQVCVYLLDAGATLESRDATGKTPLFHAILAAKPATARLLIARGAALDPIDAFGDTPLMMAASKDNAEMVDLLLRAGASPTPTDDQGRTALARAHTDAIKRLLTQ